MTARILSGCVFQQLPSLQAGSVDCVVTSPPYWMLRAYLDKDHALKALELGQEKTPAEYVANMVRVFDLVRIALADHGTVWLNIGDTYSHARGKRKPGDRHGPKQCSNPGSVQTPSPTVDGLTAGNLCLIPQRLAIALQDAGWLVRSMVIWRKPAPMPSSVTGWAWVRHRIRVWASPRARGKKGATPGQKPHQERRGKEFASTAERLYGGKGEELDPQAASERMKQNTARMRAAGGAHDNGAKGVSQLGVIDCPGCERCLPHGGYVLRRGCWRPTSSYEPILMLAKTDRYFADGEPVKTAPAAATIERDRHSRVLDDPDEQFAVKHDHETICDGANARDVQEWAAEPLREAHYAAFPTALVQWCLRAGTSAHGYCAACGAPWVRVVETKAVPHPQPRAVGREAIDSKGGNQANGSAALAPEVKTVGWRTSCDCGAPTRPGLVLDPFAGSGRTAIAAGRLGLDFVGVELNPDFVAMSRRLIHDEAPLFGETPDAVGGVP